MEPYISGSEEEVRRREVYMYYGLLVKVAELKLFTSELKLSVKGFRIYKPNSPAQPGGHTWWLLVAIRHFLQSHGVTLRNDLGQLANTLTCIDREA